MSPFLRLRLRAEQSLIFGAVASVIAVAAVTGSIFVFREWVPVLSLGVLYVFAVLPVAIGWGLAFSLPVAVASMLTFNFFFLEPVHRFTLSDSSNWFALTVYLGTAVVVSELAAHSRRRSIEAEQRRREATLLADISSDLLQGRPVDEELDRIALRTAEVLGISSVELRLGQAQMGAAGPSEFPLESSGRRVGVISVPVAEEPSVAVRQRFLPALASLLAVAAERDRLSQQALEAEALRRSDTIKTAVLRTVSHDLRSPLTAISTASSALRNEQLDLDGGDRAELLETIEIESQRLERLVANLLDLSRLQAGAAPPTQELWTVDQLVAQALDQVQDADRVEVVFPADVPVVRVDAVQIERVLVNLLENALRFAPEGSKVGIRVNVTRKEAVIRVVDTGPGLPELELVRVFEPFHRAEGDGARGAGLGLAIVRGFAEANGGRVWAESVAGQGASFAFALPVVQTPSEVPG